MSRWLTLFALSCFPAAGCNADRRSAENYEDAAARQTIEGVHLLVQTRVGNGGRPPQKAADLQPYSNVSPEGYEAVSKGEVVVVWGKTTDDSSEDVLAYFKKTPAEGGYVVRRNGKSAVMSAAEFGNLIKAKTSG